MNFTVVQKGEFSAIVDTDGRPVVRLEAFLDGDGSYNVTPVFETRVAKLIVDLLALYGALRDLARDTMAPSERVPPPSSDH